jgi:glucan-binding YG repeat protein
MNAFYNCYDLKDVMYNDSSDKFMNLEINTGNTYLQKANEYYTYYHLVFVRRNGKYYWYENNQRQAVQGDPKNIIDARFHTERGREIFDPKTKAWYWLDSVYGGAKATGKEVWMPYVYQDEAKWSYEDKVGIANDSDNGMESYVLNAMLNGDGKWVRYDGNGKMLKGWVTIDGDLAKIYPTQKGNRYYYDNQTGIMAKGYVKIGYYTYHFDEVSGKLLD